MSTLLKKYNINDIIKNINGGINMKIVMILINIYLEDMILGEYMEKI